MLLSDAEKIVEALDDSAYSTTLLPGYSGRGMYGEETAAVVTDYLPAVYYTAGELGLDNFDRWSTDSLGQGTVVY